MKKAVLVGLAVVLVPGCASLTLKPVDYSWPFESVLKSNTAGYVEGEPKTIAFDANELFRAETSGKETAADKTVRIIRDREGYYYITAAGFKNVYVFGGGEGSLNLQTKVLIAEEGMDKPFFNLRDEGVQLGANGRVFTLNKKGIVGGKK